MVCVGVCAVVFRKVFPKFSIVIFCEPTRDSEYKLEYKSRIRDSCRNEKRRTRFSVGR